MTGACCHLIADMKRLSLFTFEVLFKGSTNIKVDVKERSVPDS